MDRKITLIRHGKTPGNIEKRYIGITDEELSKEGRLELQRRQYPQADIVFVSPLLRCKQTAEIIYPNSEIVVIDELRETDFGLFEGKNYLELSGVKEYQDWIDSKGQAPFPQGESKEDAEARAIKGFGILLEQSKEASSISAIVHGGTIMAILSHLFKGDYYSYHVENGEGYTFDLSSNGLYSGLHSRSFIR